MIEESTVRGPEKGAGSSSALFDVEGAAAYLCTTQRHVRRLWQERRLAGIKIGRSVRFAESDLQAFIAQQRVEAVR